MKSALKIALIYAAVSALWIVFSDRLISLIFVDIRTLTAMASLKGMLFILVTGSILYIQIRKEIGLRTATIEKLDRENEMREQLIRELHHRIKNNIQVILSLINIETRDDPRFDDFRERINNKLISMMSVFNIVYDLRDLSRISFYQVMREYARITIRNVQVEESPEDDCYSIETITTCMILIDSILDLYFRRESFIKAMTIVNAGKGRLEIRYTERVSEPASSDDMDFIAMQLKSIGGTMRDEADSMRLVIEFAAR
jgi:hypothetical protein